MISLSEVSRLCESVNRFSHHADFRWKGLPVIIWEFADKRAYVDALAGLSRAVETLNFVPNAEPRVSEGLSEIDCYGVTFRLVLKTQ